MWILLRGMFDLMEREFGFAWNLGRSSTVSGLSGGVTVFLWPLLLMLSNCNWKKIKKVLGGCHPSGSRLSQAQFVEPPWYHMLTLPVDTIKIVEIARYLDKSFSQTLCSFHMRNCSWRVSKAYASAPTASHFPLLSYHCFPSTGCQPAETLWVFTSVNSFGSNFDPNQEIQVALALGGHALFLNPQF